MCCDVAHGAFRAPGPPLAAPLSVVGTPIELPPSLIFVVVTSSSPASLFSPSLGGKHQLPAIPGRLHMPQHWRPHTGELRAAPLNPWMCARLLQLRIELTRAWIDAVCSDLGRAGELPAKHRRAAPTSGALAAAPRMHESWAVRSVMDG
jgi:hypothetical protein